MTKTLRKRIALVAVSAMGFGLLTSVAANAAVGALTLGVGSSGLVSSTIDGGTDDVAVIAADGTLTLALATGDSTLVVSGGTIEGIASASISTGATSTISADKKRLEVNASRVTFINIKPAAAGTNLVVNSYAETTYSGTLSASQTITGTVRAAGASGTFSLANSLIALTAVSGTPESTGRQASTADVVYANRVVTRAGISYQLNDALGNNMPSTTTVTAQVTKGSCLVNTTKGSETLPFASLTAPDDTFFVTTAATDADNCDIAISVNGVVVATKNVIFHGDVAKVTVESVASANSGVLTAQVRKLRVRAYDAVGNELAGESITGDSTKYGAIVSLLTSTTTSAASATAGLTQTAGSTANPMSVTCTGTKGTQKGMRVYATNGSGALIYSDPFDVSCHGGLYSYSASLDKSSYTLGGIATLTISAKDSAGNPVADGVTLDNGQARTTNTTVTCGGQATAIQALAASDSFDGGKATYKFTLGTTEGDYNCVVTLGEYTASGTGNAALAAVTVPWSLKSSSTTVTNAEVLSAIVKLIASINKQITALQKLLTKKK